MMAKRRATQLDAIKKDLTLKQLRFCQEYVKDHNGTQAAIRAGYSKNGAQQTASKLLLNDVVQKELSRLVKRILDRQEAKAIITVEKWLEDLNTIKDRCMQAEPVMEFDRDEKKMVETGEYKFDSAGALKASDQQGKYLGAYSEDNKTKVDLSIEDLIRSKKGKE